MGKLIIVSFGFLAFAFYELSGGDDFDPEAYKMARIEMLEAEKAAKAEMLAAKRQVVIAAAPKVTATKNVIDTDPPLKDDVVRVAMNTTTATDAQPEAQIIQAVANGSMNNAQVQNAAVVTSSADTPSIILPSLIATDETDSSTVTQISSSRDMRIVSGSRVNVRSGPGTRFGVVDKLTEGDEVNVLEDNGKGWVRFQTPDGSTDGWVADFLLASG